MLIFFAACARSIDPRTIKNVDGAFSQQFNLFVNLYGKAVPNAAIGFNNLPYPKVGLCRVWSSGYWQIEIDPVYWQSASEESRKGLILHELGHCALGRDHSSQTFYYSGAFIIGQVPKSLMYPVNFYNWQYTDLESYYFNELFNPETSVPITKTSTEEEMKVVY